MVRLALVRMAGIYTDPGATYWQRVSGFVDATGTEIGGGLLRDLLNSGGYADLPSPIGIPPAGKHAHDGLHRHGRRTWRPAAHQRRRRPSRPTP